MTPWPDILLIFLLGIATETVVGWTCCLGKCPPRTLHTKLWSSENEEELNPLFSMDPNDLFLAGDKSDDDDDDDETIVDNPGSLQQILRGSDNTIPFGSDLGESSFGRYDGRLDANTLDKLQEIAQQEETMQRSNNRDFQDKRNQIEYEELPGSDNDEDMSFYLSEDEYMRASKSIKADGSLPDYMFEPNNSGELRKLQAEKGQEEEEEEMTMSDLMDAFKKQQAIPEEFSSQQAKEMRDQVFAQEEAFSSQYVESEEYKLYEQAISLGMKKNKDKNSDLVDNDDVDELDLALGELQELIDAKKWGESSSSSRTTKDVEGDFPDETLDEES